MKRWHCALSLGLVVTLAVGSVRQVDSHQLTAINVEVLDGRPLSSALLQLESRYGWTITYEDPPYEYAVDVEDVTSAVSKDPNQEHRVLVPRSRPFAFAYKNGQQPRPRDVLSAMLREYHLRFNTHEFSLIEAGSVFHVLPTMSANAKGIPTQRQSRLNAAVTVENGDRSAFELIEMVLTQVSASSGIRVVVGTVPVNFLRQTIIRAGGATNETARDVLTRTLAATGEKLSWRLFCDPGATKTCAFNVHFSSNSGLSPR